MPRQQPVNVPVRLRDKVSIDDVAEDVVPVFVVPLTDLVERGLALRQVGLLPHQLGLAVPFLGVIAATWRTVPRAFATNPDAEPGTPGQRLETAAPPAELAPLLAAEERAGSTDPYRAVGPLVHLLARRPARPPAPAQVITAP